MTKLTPENSPVIRETAVFDRGDNLIVELEPTCLTLRLKGDRNGAVTLNYKVIRDLGLRLEARKRGMR